MEKEFEAELREIIAQLGMETENDPLSQLHNYNDEMTISQVVKFFNRQGIPLTKTMVQNYVRVGVLPPPYEKRYYRREHLIMITLIDRFKNIYSLGEIKHSYTPEGESESGGGNGNVKPQEMPRFYKNYLEICSKAVEDTQESVKRDIEYLYRLTRENESADGEESVKTLFLLTLMTRGVIMKRMVEMILEK